MAKAVATPGIAGTFRLPREADSLAELERIVEGLSRRENSWQAYERLATQASVRVPPPALWLLARLAERQPASTQVIAEEFKVERDALTEPLAFLRGRRLVRRRGGSIVLTRSGWHAVQRVRQARRRNLEELLRGWQPEKHAEIKSLIDSLAHSLVREMPELR